MTRLLRSLVNPETLVPAIGQSERKPSDRRRQPGNDRGLPPNAPPERCPALSASALRAPPERCPALPERPPSVPRALPRSARAPSERPPERPPSTLRAPQSTLRAPSEHSPSAPRALPRSARAPSERPPSPPSCSAPLCPALPRPAPLCPALPRSAPLCPALPALLVRPSEPPRFVAIAASPAVASRSAPLDPLARPPAPLHLQRR